MSAPRPLEQQLLTPAAKLLDAEPSHQARMEVLEAVASALGCFSLEEYRSMNDLAYHLTAVEARSRAEEVIKCLRSAPMHPALALSALARPPLSTAEQRKAGAYYTDFRLATHLASKLPPKGLDGPVVDTACGSGILLVALTLHATGDNRRNRAAFLRNKVCGADLSSAALRGAALALAALTDDLDALASMRGRLRQQDSLIVGPAAWNDVAPDGFAALIGNPPWEKLKISRHEYLTFNGSSRHYGDDYEGQEGHVNPTLRRSRKRMTHYIQQVSSALQLQGSGEADLYKLFVELSMSALRDGGHLALLVPAGLIRSQGTARLRNHLLEEASSLEIGILHNRARFFAIDTRFKFLSVAGQVRGPGKRKPLVLSHADGIPDAVRTHSTARLGRRALLAVRPDGSLPEVRSTLEWDLFRQMYRSGTPLGEAAMWSPHICREVDMTRDRRDFSRKGTPTRVGVIEGRMVHQYRARAKRYVSGTGRSAIWEAQASGVRRIVPQFFISRQRLRPAVAERIERPRVGFCDITGQTNERSLLSALIPAGFVCGNKVPTIVFGDANTTEDQRRDLAFLWLAIANSLPFDWLLRRVLTTTVNFFVLLGLPMPTVDLESLPARRLIDLAQRLTAFDAGEIPMTLWEAGETRALIDVAVAALYDLDDRALRVMLDDFPLLDRGQSPLPGETRSTVTRDLLLVTAAEHRGGGATRELLARVATAREVGASAYVPADFVGYRPTTFTGCVAGTI